MPRRISLATFLYQRTAGAVDSGTGENFAENPRRGSARISVTLVSKEAIAPPSYEIKVTEQARKPRERVEYGARTRAL